MIDEKLRMNSTTPELVTKLNELIDAVNALIAYKEKEKVNNVKVLSKKKA